MFKHSILTLTSLLILWQSATSLFGLPPYILPSPIQVIAAFSNHYSLIMTHLIPTMIETCSGLILGILLGISTAILMDLCKPFRHWFFPILIASQSLPIIAIAPVLVLFFGFGLTSKIIATMLMLFFPVTNAFYDGLKNVPQEFIDLAKIIHANKLKVLWRIKIPAALPRLLTGIKIATALAPVGAIVSEWVGASQGLGFLMLHANARMQIDLMFAVILTTMIFSLTLYYGVNNVLKKI